MTKVVVFLLSAIVGIFAQQMPGFQPGPPGGRVFTGPGGAVPQTGFQPGTVPGGLRPGVGPAGPGGVMVGRSFPGLDSSMQTPTRMLTDQSWMFDNPLAGLTVDSSQFGGLAVDSNQFGGLAVDSNQFGGLAVDSNQFGGLAGAGFGNGVFGFGNLLSPSSPIEMLMRRVAQNPNNYRYATCVFNETWSPVRGRLDFRQFLIGEGREQVSVRVQLSGLPASVGEVERGIHVHEFGDTGDGCARVGPHFNPNQTPHGSRRNFAFLRHVGNFGNIRQSPEGLVSTQSVDSVISLEGVNNIVGRAVAIKFERDDEGMGGTRDSQVNGNTHTPIACCTIGRTTARNWYNPMSVRDIQNMANTGIMPYYTVNQNLFGANPNRNTNPNMVNTNPSMANMGAQPGMMQFGAGTFMPGGAPGQTFNFGGTQGKK